MRSHMFQKVFRVVIIMAFTSVTVAQAAPIELTKATYQDHLRPTAAIKTPLADDIKSSLKGFPGVTVHEETFTPNVEELLSSRLSRYEGIAISRNSQIVVKPNASAVVNNLAILLNLSFSKIKPFISYNIPDGDIQIHIVEHLPANAHKLIDSSGKVHLLFDKSFIEALLFNQDEYPEAAVWLLAERLAHELSHNNTIGTQQQERQEEIDIIINTDLQLYRRLLANKPLKDEVDRFFANVRPSFGSGRYFDGLLEEIVDKSPAEIREAVETYVDIYSDFDAMQFPAGFHPIRNAKIKSLIRKLRNKDPDVREYAALLALGKIGPAAKEAVPALIKALEDEDGDVRSEAAKALGEIGPVTEEVIPALIKALEDEDIWVRKSTAYALVKIGSAAKEAVPALIKVLEDENWLVREYAAYALVEIGPAAKAAVPALIKALGDEEPWVRRTAAKALGEIGPVTEEVIPALIKALGDKNFDVREYAAEALGKIGPVTNEVIPALLKALGDESKWVRRYAVEALVEIGPVTIPALRKALGDKKWNVRKSAAAALRKIDTDSAPPTTGTKSFPAGNEKFITRLSDIQNILLDAPLLPDQEHLLSESLQGLNKIDADLIGVKQQDRILRPLVSDIQSRIALQRSIIGLAGFCRGVVRVDSDGMIIFDPEIIQDEKQRQAVISILSDSTMLSALEDALSAKDEKGKIAARTRVVLLTDVLTNRVALGKNSILISNEQKIDNVKLLNVAGVKSEQGFFPVPQLIALARGLLSINKENFSKLYPAVNRLYIRLTQSTIPDELKAVLENCSWSEFELIIYILPSAEALDQKETEKLHRQALAAMIAA